MLNGTTTHFHVLSKAGSFGAKLCAVGMTAFGLSKLWSPESKQKLSFPSRIAFSSAYVLHIGATSLTVAACFGAGPVSAPVATALVGVTSMLTSYANLMESYISHSVLQIKYSALEKELVNKKLDLQRSHALNESANQCEIQMNELTNQITELKFFATRLHHPLLPLEELKEIYLSLEEKYQTQVTKNEIISHFFKNLFKNPFTINSILNEIHEKISLLREQTEHLQLKLQNQKNEETISRIQRVVDRLEQKNQKWGILNIQCIKYKKIEEHIQQLQNLSIEIDNIQQRTSMEANHIEKQFLENRISNLYANLANMSHLNEVGFSLDLELGMVTTFNERIDESPDKFQSWLQTNLEQHIECLEQQAHAVRDSAEKIQLFYKEQIKSSMRDVKNQLSDIRQIDQAMLELKKFLTLEKFNEDSKKTKVNFSRVSSAIALSLCVIPHAGTSNLLKTLMLGFGILGSGSSLWDFYNKNLLTKKIVTQQKKKMQRLNKELAFRMNLNDQKKQHSNLEQLLQQTIESHKQQTIAIAPPKKCLLPPRKEISTRTVKLKAKTLIFNSSLKAKQRAPQRLVKERTNISTRLNRIR